ncbi:MAG: DUF4198 domain-containing protein [Chromatiales bacterium]|nr:DUF4198 domain-containing protein [Chromatiales bacterium]
MKSHRRLAGALALALALPLTGAQAHHVWLLPSTTVLSKSATITVDAAVSNDLFYFNYRPLPLDEGFSVIAPDGGRIEPENPAQGELRTVFDLQLSRPGTHRLQLVSQGLMARWMDGEQQRRFRGRPEDFARRVPADAAELEVTEFANRLETFVTLGKPTALELSGQGLELEFATHPNDLYAGERADFRLMAEGRPAAGVEVMLIAGGSRYRDQLDEIKVTTDEEGRFSVTWPGPGRYWLNAVIRDTRVTQQPAGERRLSYTATLEVLP